MRTKRKALDKAGGEGEPQPQKRQASDCDNSKVSENDEVQVVRSEDLESEEVVIEAGEGSTVIVVDEQDLVNASTSDSVDSAAKTKKYGVSFQKNCETYNNLDPCWIPSEKGDNFAFCTACKTSIFIKCGGLDSKRDHIGTNKHKDNKKDIDKRKKLPKMTAYYSPKQSTATVMRSKLVFIDLVNELNLPTSTHDVIRDAVKKAFPASKKAQAYACGHTKATSVLKEVAAMTTNEVVSRMMV